MAIVIRNSIQTSLYALIVANGTSNSPPCLKVGIGSFSTTSHRVKNTEQLSGQLLDTSAILCWCESELICIHDLTGWNLLLQSYQLIRSRISIHSELMSMNKMATYPVIVRRVVWRVKPLCYGMDKQKPRVTCGGAVVVRFTVTRAYDVDSMRLLTMIFA